MKTGLAIDFGTPTLLDSDMAERMRAVRRSDELEALEQRPVFEPLERAWRLSGSTHVFARKDSVLPPAIDRVFGALAVPELERRAKRILSLDARPVDGGAVRIFANGLPIVRVRADDELAPSLEGTIVGFAVRTREDAAALHAASIEIGGRAVLLPGGKGSGKSTLVLKLVEQQAGRYFGDELAFIRFADRQLEAFPKAVTLKEGSFGLFAECDTHQDAIRGPVRYRLPARAARPGEAAPVGSIIFPRFSAEGPPVKMEKIDQAQAAFDLIRQCFGGLERDPRTMSVVAALSVAPAYTLEYSDAEAAAKQIIEIVCRNG